MPCPIHNLGVMYANGQGVLQNDKTAAQWYRCVAEQGNASAQLNLGVMYARGEACRRMTRWRCSGIGARLSRECFRPI
ncbi:MAG: tetratricopeptide repeat protein [Candidatus Eutrophobiaceae bacterium]